MINSKKVIIRKKSKSILAYSTKVKSFVKKKPNSMKNTFDLIKNNFKKLKNGQVIKSKGMTISSIVNGKFKGLENSLVLKVSIGRIFFLRKNFFVKVGKFRSSADNVLNAYNKLQDFLSKNNNKILDVNVDVLPHHLFLQKSGKFHYFIVTDFLSPSRFNLVSEMKDGKTKTKLIDVISKVSKEGANKLKVYDIAPHNVFYDKKKNKLLFFDMAEQIKINSVRDNKK